MVNKNLPNRSIVISNQSPINNSIGLEDEGEALSNITLEHVLISTEYRPQSRFRQLAIK